MNCTCVNKQTQISITHATKQSNKVVRSIIAMIQIVQEQKLKANNLKLSIFALLLYLSIDYKSIKLCVLKPTFSWFTIAISII